jgi:dTDP-glucose pyrophosphorylase
MKGVLLAGGTGSRLHPLTRVTNKHLMPVFDRPMIYFPLETLRGMGIEKVMVILGGRSIGDIVELLSDGHEHLRPSGRGEFEITDVLNHYLARGERFWRHYAGQWTDAGTVESLLRASQRASDASTAAKPPSLLASAG